MYSSNRPTAEQTQEAIDRMALGDVASVVTIERQILTMPDSGIKERLHQAFERKAQPLINATFEAAGGQGGYTVREFQSRLRRRTGSDYQFTLADMIGDDAMSDFVRQAAREFPRVPVEPVRQACCDESDALDFDDETVVRAVLDDEDVQRAVGRRFLQVLAERFDI